MFYLRGIINAVVMNVLILKSFIFFFFPKCFMKKDKTSGKSGEFSGVGQLHYRRLLAQVIVEMMIKRKHMAVMLTLLILYISYLKKIR